MSSEPQDYWDVDSEPYFDGLRRGDVAIQRCASCQAFQFPPRAFCVHCGAESLDWRIISGTGTIYALTVCHRPGGERFVPLVPYAVALIDLAEGVRVMAVGITGCNELQPGDHVEVFANDSTLSRALLFNSSEGATS